MQKIVIEKPKEITIDSLSGSELVAYRSQNSEGVCVLSKINKANSFGFIRLSNSNSHPVFVADGWFNSVKAAASARQLVAFDNINEMVEAIVSKKF
jgi:hypothetical protein